MNIHRKVFDRYVGLDANGRFFAGCVAVGLFAVGSATVVHVAHAGERATVAAEQAEHDRRIAVRDRQVALDRAEADGRARAEAARQLREARRARLAGDVPDGCSGDSARPRVWAVASELDDDVRVGRHGTSAVMGRTLEVTSDLSDCDLLTVKSYVSGDDVDYAVDRYVVRLCEELHVFDGYVRVEVDVTFGPGTDMVVSDAETGWCRRVGQDGR